MVRSGMTNDQLTITHPAALHGPAPFGRGHPVLPEVDAVAARP